MYAEALLKGGQTSVVIVEEVTVVESYPLVGTNLRQRLQWKSCPQE